MSKEKIPDFVRQLFGNKIKILENESSLLEQIMATLTLPRNQSHISETLKLFIEGWKVSYDRIRKGES